MKLGILARWAIVCLSLATASAQTTPTLSAAESQPRTPTYWLRITGDRVSLRARPDSNSLLVARLDTDAVLRATGEEFGWHAVYPPKGVYALVSADYIDRRGPTEGVVSLSSGKLRVRNGSLVHDVDPLKMDVQALLPLGERVHIIGEQDGWLRIVPPTDVLMYVRATYAEKISETEARKLQERARRDAQAAARKPIAVSHAGVDLSGAWGQQLTGIEGRIRAEEKKPDVSQSWPPIVAALRPIAEQREEPAVARLASEWARRLREHDANRAALVAARAILNQDSGSRARLEDELKQIRKAQAPPAGQNYVARGQLLVSEADSGQSTTPGWKLRDPLSGKIVAYVRITEGLELDPKPFVGHYVGLHGKARHDARLGLPVVYTTWIARLDDKPAARPTRQSP